MHYYRFILFTGLLLLASHLVVADPLNRSQNFIQAFKAINAKQTDETAYKNVDAFINFNILSQDAIKPHRDKFSAQQASTFQTLFTQLIRLIAYPDTGLFFTENKYSYGKAINKDNLTLIPLNVLITEEDLEMELGLYWHQYQNQWLLTDISIDEDSMVKDYQNQFGRIINKSSVPELLKKLENKIAEIQQPK